METGIFSVLIFLLLLLEKNVIFSSKIPTQINKIYPFMCLDRVNTCNAQLYIHNDLSPNQISSYYAVKKSDISLMRQDHIVSVPCSCKNVTGTVGYFYDIEYQLQEDDTFINVSETIFSGQLWKVGGEEKSYKAEEFVTMHLLCGCVEEDSRVVVTYTVQQSDTLFRIADLFSVHVDEIENLNPYLSKNPGYINVGWLLYAPMKIPGIPSTSQNKLASSSRRNYRMLLLIIAIIVSIVIILCVCIWVITFFRGKILKRNKGEDRVLAISKTSGSLKYRQQDLEMFGGFESERPLVYTLEDVSEATGNFDEAMKIGEGGYGSVYFGKIGKKEIAIKKMKSNKSKEFVAELKVLFKIHHINVVELLGYASGHDHLYLVYEYVPNGALSEHLHDPLLQGRQPLSWTARAQIALDAARGIEYIHDHTKSRYVHRDIKTSNILLDETLRAKVADFGLAKLVSRTSNEDLFTTTRLVGTPGYLPPESVQELQVTTKTDVFALGVVLAELITGKRALIRDNRDPNKMKSLITILKNVFEEKNPEIALEQFVDGNLKGCYPMENVYKMAEVSVWCLSEDAMNRPEMREVVVILCDIKIFSIEWEASLGGNSQVFSGLFNGR